MYSSLQTRTRRWRESRQQIDSDDVPRLTTTRAKSGGTFVADLGDSIGRKFFVDRADDGELAALALSVIRSQSVASVLCIIVSEPNPLTSTSTPTQHKRSGWRPSQTLTREQLEHPVGQSLPLEQTKLSLGAGSYSASGRGTYGRRCSSSSFALAIGMS